MPGFEEEAFQRAQRISRPRTQREKPEAPSEPKKPEPIESKSVDNNSEKEIKPNPRPQTSLLDVLFRDKEKSIIIALMLLLSDENNDPSLLLALAYLLI